MVAAFIRDFLRFLLLDLLTFAAFLRRRGLNRGAMLALTLAGLVLLFPTA